MQRELHAQQLLVAKYSAQLDDLENRLRRNNIRAIGIPENMEGEKSCAFYRAMAAD